MRVAHAPERFSHHRGLPIPTCITARAWRTCRDACWDHLLVVSFEVGGGENVPDIPGACATRNFTCLVRGPFPRCLHYYSSDTVRSRYITVTFYTPARTKFERGVYCNQIVRLSVYRHSPVTALTVAILLRSWSNLVRTYLGSRTRPSSFMGVMAR